MHWVSRLKNCIKKQQLCSGFHPHRLEPWPHRGAILGTLSTRECGSPHALLCAGGTHNSSQLAGKWFFIYYILFLRIKVRTSFLVIRRMFEQKFLKEAVSKMLASPMLEWPFTASFFYFSTNGEVVTALMQTVIGVVRGAQTWPN